MQEETLDCFVMYEDKILVRFQLQEMYLINQEVYLCHVSAVNSYSTIQVLIFIIYKIHRSDHHCKSGLSSVLV